MTSGSFNPKPDYVYFLDDEDYRHHKGTIVFGWSGYTGTEGTPEPPIDYPMLELGEVEYVLDFLREHFPDGWEIKDGKVVGCTKA